MEFALRSSFFVLSAFKGIFELIRKNTIAASIIILDFDLAKVRCGLNYSSLDGAVGKVLDIYSTFRLETSRHSLRCAFVSRRNRFRAFDVCCTGDQLAQRRLEGFSYGNHVLA